MAANKLFKFIDNTRVLPFSFDRLSFVMALEILNDLGKDDKNYNPLYELKTLSLVYGTSVNKEDLIKQFTLVLGDEIGHYLDLELKSLDDVMIKNLIDSSNVEGERLIDSKEDYIELCNYLYSGYGKSQFDITTPQTLNSLMAKILDLKPEESIYDCTSGTGASLLSAASQSNLIYSQEIVRQATIKQELAFKLLGYQNVVLSTDNSLLNPMVNEEYVDKAVCNPPFSIKLMEEPDEFVSSIGDVTYQANREADIYFYNLVTKAVRKKAVFIAANGLLFKQTRIAVAFKEWLCKSGLLEAVVQLPGGLFAPYTKIPTVLLVINKEKNNSKVMMLDISESKFVLKDKRLVMINPRNMNELVDVINNKTEISGISALATIDEISAGEWNLTPSRFIEVVSEEEAAIDVQALIDQRNLLLDELKKQSDIVNEYIMKTKGAS